MTDGGTTIVLPPKLAEPLYREAERQGMGIDDLVSNLIAQYLGRMEPDKLSQEAESFRAMHDRLLARFAGSMWRSTRDEWWTVTPTGEPSICGYDLASVARRC